MRRILIFFLLTLIFTSCSEKEKIMLDAEKVYLVRYRSRWLDDYSTRLTINGFAEIDKSFSTNIYVCDFVGDKGYYQWQLPLDDSTKTRINRVIDSYPVDTSFYDENNVRLYSGLYAFLLIKKADGKQVFLDLDIEDLRNELELLYNELPDRTGHVDTSKGVLANDMKVVYNIVVEDLAHSLPKWMFTDRYIAPPAPPRRWREQHGIDPKLIIAAPVGIVPDTIDYLKIINDDE
ncbi:hypothetical protein M2451_002359 [Dysgonomonas sp. PFB1-18]|uniref:hypothetical protein n=1 Tax=unclassified Dysgonomonas TaxID=2630389 RepID=UPI002473FE08|nr:MULTISPECIES: hypothetical protein [unclassified Dysgonomonas]MDL2303243.1 hypothetical protein [Dysgonomonas sp. OttesenSCG-928-D17]MDH6307125.1 hypothetical protein [Dysgonomonas sp. PF1-14]MDH6337044.1 hypothetical protein [Dysgonomonas sp. PF1-16]MDH6381030.1 hypothetical protein [Dysgonomonas sp. PFB1-18]MDH6396391.1 hypothetical protein [Dysgonomonas sp. PF1-23]